MKFSIIIPIFNAEKYILESVSSVLNQTYKDFEIILVDDGSSDSSAKICDALADEYNTTIKVVHQENKGQILSRCVGAEVAQGEYCVYLDADDLLYVNCLEKLADVIADFSKPDIVIYNFERLASSGEKICKPIPLKSGFVYEEEQKNQIYNILMSGSMLNSMCNKCVRRESLVGCYEQFTKYQSLRCGEDRLQVLESVTRANSILFIEDVLYCYRLFDGSITRNFDISQIDKFNMGKLYEAENAYLLKWGLNSEEWQKKLENRFLNETIYIFSKFYERAKNNKDRTLIVDYDWESFIPSTFSVVELKKYNSETIELYEKIIEKKYLLVRLYFFKKSVYKNYKKLKSKVTK